MIQEIPGLNQPVSGAAGSPRTQPRTHHMPGGGGLRLPEALDVIVLAGGTGRRLGGASKPDVIARGSRLLDHVLTGLATLKDVVPLGRVVVIAPQSVQVPPGVLQTVEEPPLGGPVAGIAAGLAALEAHGEGTRPATALLTCDAPEAWKALPLLTEALARAGVSCAGAVPVSPDGGQRHVQYLLGVYRTLRLTDLVAPGGVGLRDVAVWRTFRRLPVTEVELVDLRAAVQDLDTWEQVRAWDEQGRLLPRAPGKGRH